MKVSLQWICLRAAAVSTVAILSLGGCATQNPQKPLAIEQRIQNARTAEDHREISIEYEREAAASTAKAKQHSEMSRKYKYFVGPKSSTPGAFARHCDNLAKLYKQAAVENSALAKLHHEAAAETPSTDQR